RSVWAVVSRAVTSSTSMSTVKPCASMTDSVQPSRDASSNSSARRRVVLVLRLRLGVGIGCLVGREGYRTALLFPAPLLFCSARVAHLPLQIGLRLAHALQAFAVRLQHPLTSSSAEVRHM